MILDRCRLHLLTQGQQLKGAVTMTAIIPFTFEAATIRTMTTFTGEPLFCLFDVCAVLELSNPSMVATRLDYDERHVLSLTDTIGREQPALFVTESGLWSVVLRSDKPQAKRFRKWLTAEVIPSIRRTGAYTPPWERCGSSYGVGVCPRARGG